MFCLMRQPVILFAQMNLTAITHPALQSEDVPIRAIAFACTTHAIGSTVRSFRAPNPPSIDEV